MLIDHDLVETLEAVILDGTSVNTGWKTGLLATLERHPNIKRKLLWLVCMLHGNELDFRHLFCHCDGGYGTSGPDSFKGPLGQSCARNNIHEMDVVDFRKIPSNLLELKEPVVKQLSRDQNLLYRYIKAIDSGVLPDNLVGQVPGPPCHARWLTLAVRLMILYTRTAVPCCGLNKVVKYIVQVYGPSWFAIKCKPKFTAGPSHLFNKLKLIRDTQSMEVQNIVKKHIQRNAYLSEPGVMLLSMLESQEKEVRVKAIKIIQKNRSRPQMSPKSKIL